MSDRCTRSNANAAWTCVLPEGHEGDHIYTLWSEIAIHAEAAIQRVREFLADKDEGLTDDARAQGHFILVDTASVLRALDGDA
jgi:hypothetical protein